MPMYYATDETMAIHYKPDGGYIVLDKEQLAALDENARAYALSRRSMTPADVALAFPSGKAAARAALKAARSELANLPAWRHEAKRLVYAAFPQYKDQELANQMLEAMLMQPVEGWLKARINELDRILVIMEVGRNEELESMVKRAKEYPITDIIKFTGNKTKSIWNTADSNPSMVYYSKENRVWCYSTQRGGDAIDVAMTVYGMDFIQAVRFLNGT